MGAEKVRDGVLRGFWGSREGIGPWSDKVRISGCARSHACCARAEDGKGGGLVALTRRGWKWYLTRGWLARRKGALTAPGHPRFFRPRLQWKAQKAFKVRVVNPAHRRQARIFVSSDSYFHVPWELRPLHMNAIEYSTYGRRTFSWVWVNSGSWMHAILRPSFCCSHCSGWPFSISSLWFRSFLSSSFGTLNSIWSPWLCCCLWCGTTSSSYRGRIPGKMWWVTR